MEEFQKGKVSFSSLLFLASCRYLESLMDSIPSSSLFLFVHNLKMTPLVTFRGFSFLICMYLIIFEVLAKPKIFFFAEMIFVLYKNNDHL